MATDLATALAMGQVGQAGQAARQRRALADRLVAGATSGRPLYSPLAALAQGLTAGIGGYMAADADIEERDARNKAIADALAGQETQRRNQQAEVAAITQGDAPLEDGAQGPVRAPLTGPARMDALAGMAAFNPAAAAQFQLEQRRADEERRERERAEDLAFRERSLGLQAAAAGRETFGEPVRLMQNGQPVVVQIGNRGTVRPMQGFDLPRSGGFEGNSIEGQALNILLDPRSDPASPAYEAAFLRSYGPRQERGVDGRVVTIMPALPPGIRVPPSLANEFGRAAPQAPAPASLGPSSINDPGALSVESMMPPARAQQPTMTPAGDVSVNRVQLPGGGAVITSETRPRTLTPAELNLREETENNLRAAQSARAGLERALELSPLAYSGPAAGLRGYAAGFTGFDERTATATREFNTIMGQQALAQLRAIFGGNPTEGERRILLDLEANANLSRPEREALIRRATEAVQRREIEAATRLEQVVQGRFSRVDPGFQAPQRTPVAPTQRPRVTSPAEAERLPPGTEYETPDGQVFRR